MTASQQPAVDLTEPMIVAATLAAGHDGLAELAVVVRYPNGAERELALPYETIGDAIDRSNVVNVTDLIGQPWTVLAFKPPNPNPNPKPNPKPEPRGAP